VVFAHNGPCIKQAGRFGLLSLLFGPVRFVRKYRNDFGICLPRMELLTCLRRWRYDREEGISSFYTVFGGVVFCMCVFPCRGFMFLGRFVQGPFGPIEYRGSMEPFSGRLVLSAVHRPLKTCYVPGASRFHGGAVRPPAIGPNGWAKRSAVVEKRFPFRHARS